MILYRIAFVLLLASAFTLSSCKKDQVQTINTGGTFIPSSNIILASCTNGANSQLQILDTAGHVIITKNISNGIWNFEKWNVNGNIRYTYAEQNGSIPNTGGNGSQPTWDVILDDKLNEIKRVSLLSHDAVVYNSPPAYDLHDFILIDENHYIGLAYEQKVVNNIPAGLNPVPNCKVTAPIIQEVENGSVIWEWDGTSYAEFYATSVEGNKFSDSTVSHDYMHINSIFIDPKDNNLICSFRNLNQVVKISRTSGDVIWRLGGTNSDFVLNGSMKFLRQHHATLAADGESLTLLDNGEVTERPYSRVLEFKLDAPTHGIVFFRAINLPNNSFVQFTGSVQKIHNTYFIGCGPLSKYFQVNFVTNSIVTTNTLTFQSYRVLRY